MFLFFPEKVLTDTQTHGHTDKMITVPFRLRYAARVITVSNGEDNYCLSDCNSQHQPSLYEQHCCNLSNIGNTFKNEKEYRLTFIICPFYLLTCFFQFYNYPFSSCADIYKANPDVKSGYYNITLTNGSIVTVYCDMEGINCGVERGWTRVAYLNMTEPGTICPSGLTQTGFNNLNLNHVCGRSTASSKGSCNSTFFSTYSLNYTNVCGQVRGYQFGTPDAFQLIPTNSIESYYVDGVSITYDSNPRQHIWTYVGGRTETQLNSQGCPCNNGSFASPFPPFVGNDYYCESGTYSSPPYSFYADDPLWDGQNCNGPESTCCTNLNMPWFLKTLNETTTDDIELRVCSNNRISDEDTPLDIIEIYVK